MTKIYKNYLILVLVIGLVITSGKVQRLFRPKAKDGINYVMELERNDLTKLKHELKETRKKELDLAIKNNEVSVYSLFEDFVIYGDSRTYAFKARHYFSDGVVFADTGHTIKNISDWNEKLKVIQPSCVFLAYGINDLGLKLDKEQENGYKGLLKQMIEENILAIVPNAKIYINSIITCTPEAMYKSPNWLEIDNYNKQIKQLCEENNWVFIDNSLLSDGTNLRIYQEDGVHFADWFYEVWTQHMYDSMEE